MTVSSRFRFLILSVLAIAAVGCTSEETIQARAEQGSRLKPLAALYGQYMGRNRGRAPADEATFRTFVEENGSGIMESFSVASIDDLFVSERDGQPFQIIYRGDKQPTVNGKPVVAYEQQGIEGNIFVTDDLGDVREVPATDLMK